MDLLTDGERVEADDGYRGEAPKYVRCPAVCMTAIEEFERMESISRRRHETINKRFKQFGALKQVWRQRLMNHGKAFRVAATVTQLSIQHGEPLFDIDYVDPNWDDDYIARIEYGSDLAAV